MTRLKQRAQKLIKSKRDAADEAMRAVGCPYFALDPRALPWIEGYKAGLAFMREAIKP